MKQIQIVIFIICYLYCPACQSLQDKEDALKQVFDAQEMVEVNKIIDYYDSYVWSHTENKTLTLEEAYEQFAEKNTALTLTGNDVFVPSREERIAFFETLDPVFLDTMFHIADTFYLYKMGSDELVDMVYYPYIFQLRYRRYLDLLEILSVRNNFFETYYERVDMSGDISPGMYSLIYSSHFNDSSHIKAFAETFDFSRKDERFTFIVPFLFINDVRVPVDMKYEIIYKNELEQKRQ